MRRVVLDTDLAMGAPGADIDDGFALALAVADPDISLELVTTVNGNTHVDAATRLSLELLDRLGSPDVPVVRGAEWSLSGWRQRSPDLPAVDPAVRRREARPMYGAAALVETVLGTPGQITIVAIGPLTNVALALALEPKMAQDVEEIVVMGGAFLEHINKAAMPGEFNTWADPGATATVLASGAPLRFVGLDVTRRVRLSRSQAQAMAESATDLERFAGACTLDWITTHSAWNPGDAREQDSCAMHDPLAVVAVTRPDLMTWRDAYVQVETASPVTRGVMVADLLMGADPPQPNCRIAVDVDASAALDLILERLGSL